MSTSSKGIRMRRCILVFIREFVGEEGYSPSFAEVAGAVGLKSVSTVAHHLDMMETTGSIKRRPRRARSIQLLDRTGRAASPSIVLDQ